MYTEQYNLWLKNAIKDPDLIEELKNIEGNAEEIKDRFWRSLEFGTGGLRGVIGAGTNRINIYTVAQATQGLANYLNEYFDEPTVAIGYDSRIKSDLFAEAAACVLAANGIKVYMYGELKPTPMISWAVRRFGCSSGIVITASHNPAIYNGYKCYDERGYQMTDEAAARTLEYIKKIDIFNDVKTMDFVDALADDMVDYIEDWLEFEYFDELLKTRVNIDKAADADLKILYTPLNGTGNKPVRHILKRAGFKNVAVVASQEKPDGNFPTCPFPNPEIRQVFEEGLKMTADFDADIIIATDPDADRIGIAVPYDGEYKLMTGNEVGCLMADYLLSERAQKGTLPENPLVVKTIVTSELITAITKKFGGEIADLLTGFKYIGELITELESKGMADNFVVGMEESYGYLIGTHVRDKDAVVSALIIAEMASFYKKNGKNLYARMQEIYAEFGMYINTLLNFGFAGADGMEKMLNMMNSMRENTPENIAGMKVLVFADYLTQKVCDKNTGEISGTNLPQSNVLSFTLEDGNKVIVRPSGTEPKIKIYITAHAKTRDKAEILTDKIAENMKEIMGIE